MDDLDLDDLLPGDDSYDDAELDEEEGDEWSDEYDDEDDDDDLDDHDSISEGDYADEDVY
jgi:hypothetical protein